MFPHLQTPPALPGDLPGTPTSPVELSLTAGGGESQVDMPPWKGSLKTPTQTALAKVRFWNLLFIVRSSHERSKKFYKEIP